MYDVQIGILDLGWRPTGRSAGDVLVEMTESVQLAEGLGYGRYWLAEHHGDGFAHASPELLIPLLAGMTRTIRIGTAGVLLRCYRAHKVASDFALLETLFPGRIDLGVARALPDAAVVGALVAGEVMPFEAAVRALARSVRGDDLGHLRRESPLWIMAHGRTADLAADLGAGLALSVCHGASRPDPAIVSRYRDGFVARGSALARPAVVVAVAGICADSIAAAEARWHDPPRRPAMVPNVLGTPAEWRRFLDEVIACYRPDELLFVDLCTAPADRTRSYTLFAAAAAEVAA